MPTPGGGLTPARGPAILLGGPVPRPPPGTLVGPSNPAPPPCQKAAPWHQTRVQTILVLFDLSNHLVRETHSVTANPMCYRVPGGFNRSQHQRDLYDARRQNTTANHHLITHSAYTKAKLAYTV